MGNTGWRRSKKIDVVTVTEAGASRRAVADHRKQRRDNDDAAADDHQEEQTTRASWRRRRPGGVLRRAGDYGDGAGGTVVTVKVVMRRKDAEALAARLSARARKVRMAELKGELLRAGGATSPASCRDACWSPMLPPIKENTN
jgi:hypothetical protein